jgi:hypothetical protein
MATITLDEHDTARLVTYLEALSDLLTAQWAEQYSGIDRMLTLSTIQEVDRLAIEVRDQLGITVDRVSAPYDYSPEGVV